MQPLKLLLLARLFHHEHTKCWGNSAARGLVGSQTPWWRLGGQEEQWPCPGPWAGQGAEARPPSPSGLARGRPQPGSDLTSVDSYSLNCRSHIKTVYHWTYHLKECERKFQRNTFQVFWNWISGYSCWTTAGAAITPPFQTSVVPHFNCIVSLQEKEQRLCVGSNDVKK